MKKTAQILLFILALVSYATTAQDYIREYNGIPLISSLPHDCGVYHYDTVKATGIKFVAMANVNSQRLDSAKNRGFKVIPVQLHDSLLDRPYSYILRYTEARYSKWEAEGTPAQDGLATLTYNDTIGTYFNEGNISGIVTKPNASAGTLIKGPGYRQEIYYTTKEAGDSIIYYADFRLKLENVSQGGLPTDTICILQVVDSKIQGPPQVNYYIGEIDFLRDTVVRRQDLTTGVWKTFTIPYELTELDTVDIETMANRHSVDDSTWLPDRRYAQFIEFKVIWKGDIHSKLYVDNINAYDYRGDQIVNMELYKERVATQANNSFNLAGWDTLVAAWYAFDEPESIDQYEPIRIVDSILNSQSNGRRRLFVSFPGSWNGKYGDSPFGAQPLYKHEEFFRRVKTIRMSNNAHIYGPYHEGDEGDYRLRNIDEIVNNILKRLNDIDSTFDMTLICGKYHKARIGRAPTPVEMHYEANLKLMFGAKSLSLYRYFGADNDTNFTGLVNYDTTWYEPQTGYYHYTDRYWFVRNTLAPSLNGLFGKTIRNLKQTVQYAGSNGVNTSLGNNCNIEYIRKIQAVQPDSNRLREGFMDLGFFNEPGGYNKKYFILLNRYYSDALLDKYDITIQYLFPYKNWIFTDYVDNNTYNICAASDWTFLFRDTITRGAAGLYGLKPVMIYGGTLNCDESLQNAATLQSELIVNPGVTLTVNNSLTSYGDIRLKNGAKLRTTNNEIGGTITFISGNLIVEGDVEINGLPNKKLTLNFTAPVDDNGIKVYNENKLTIKNTVIKNAYKGIFVDVGELYIDSSEITDCNTGLYLNKTVYQPDIHEGTKIWNSTIHDNNSAVTLLESSAMVVGNEFASNSPFGVMCLENSSPIFGEIEEPGLNHFKNNDVNLYSYASFPIVGIGEKDYIAGYNGFEGNNVHFHIAAMEKSLVMAEQNWWGQEEPNPEKFETDENSEIDYIPFLYTPPFDSKSSPENTKDASSGSNLVLEVISPNETFRRALKYLLKGDKNNCRNLLKNILQNYRDSVVALAALNLLHKTYIKSAGKDSLKTYLQQFTTSNIQSDIFVYAKLLLADFDKINYTMNLNSILNGYSNSSLKDLVYFKQFKHYLFDKSARDSARYVSNQMVALFPESPLTKETKFLLGDYALSKNTSNIAGLPLSYFIGNYPNPFNPTTTIKYSLPKAEKVNISIYDVLGRKVKELVNEQKEQGTYEIKFNANNLSSGVYFYRIVTKDFVKTMKMILLR